MVRPLAGRGTAVMTTAAHADDLGMINPVGRYRYPGGGEFVMTGIARVSAVDMHGRLATGIESVMATNAIAHETGMVGGIGRAQPGRGGMTGIAFRRGNHMAETLTGGGRPIVATAANADDLGMVDPVGRYRQPIGGELVMTGVTHI